MGERLPYKQRVTGSSPVSSIFYLCGYGGTGRRARFRFLCPLWRGGSNPLIRIFVARKKVKFLPSLFRASEYYIETTVEAVAK